MGSTECPDIYDKAFLMIIQNVVKCFEKYGVKDATSLKLHMVNKQMQNYTDRSGVTFDSTMVFNLGELAGTTSYYLEKGKLAAEHMNDLNKIYKRYK